MSQSVERHHAPGGWRRATVGVLLGSVLGAWFTRLVPRDVPVAGRRRRGDRG